MRTIDMKAIDPRACLIGALFALVLAGCASAAADATVQPAPAQAPAQGSIPF